MKERTIRYRHAVEVAIRAKKFCIGSIKSLIGAIKNLIGAIPFFLAMILCGNSP
jgi:hypothetical protein